MQHHAQKPWKSSVTMINYGWLSSSIITYFQLRSTVINKQVKPPTSTLHTHVLLRRHRFDSVWLPAPDPGIPWKIVGFPKEPYRNACIPKINLSSPSPTKNSTSCWIRCRIGGSLGKSVGEKASLGYMWLRDQDPLILHLESNSRSPVIPKRVVVRSTPPRTQVANRHKWRVLLCDSRS